MSTASQVHRSFHHTCHHSYVTALSIFIPYVQLWLLEFLAWAIVNHPLCQAEKLAPEIGVRLNLQVGVK